MHQGSKVHVEILILNKLNFESVVCTVVVWFINVTPQHTPSDETLHTMLPLACSPFSLEWHGEVNWRHKKVMIMDWDVNSLLETAMPQKKKAAAFFITATVYKRESESHAKMLTTQHSTCPPPQPCYPECFLQLRIGATWPPPPGRGVGAGDTSLPVLLQQNLNEESLCYLLLLSWQKFQQLAISFFWIIYTTAAIFLSHSLCRRLWKEYAV